MPQSGHTGQPAVIDCYQLGQDFPNYLFCHLGIIMLIVQICLLENASKQIFAQVWQNFQVGHISSGNCPLFSGIYKIAATKTS